ncbi:DUF6893 family small protein [Streptomyces sp. NPDC049040]
MRILGRVTAGLAAATAVAGLAAAVLSIPDIRRYLRMRSM